MFGAGAAVMEGRCKQVEDTLNCKGLSQRQTGAAVDEIHHGGEPVEHPIKRQSRLKRASTVDFVSACFGKQIIMCNLLLNGN